MDEIQLVARARPEADPPTPAERAAIRTAVVGHLSEGTTAARITGPGWDDVPPGRPGSRRVARVVLAAAAVAVVVAAVVGALSLGGDERGSDQPTVDAPGPSEPSPGGPYPAPPFTVAVAVSAQSTGGASPARSVDGRIVLHQVDEEVGVADVTGCMECDGTMLMLHLRDVPLDGPEAEVRAAVEALVVSAIEPGTRLAVVESLLSDPAAGPVARAEALRALARTEGLVVEEGVTTALGAVGTRYTATEPRYDSAHSVVVDPTDGFVLEVQSANGPDPASTGVGEVTGPAGRFPIDARVETRISYERPIAVDRVPADVLGVAEAVRGSPQGRPAQGSCAAAGGNEQVDGTVHVIPLPSHLAYAYCPVG